MKLLTPILAGALLAASLAVPLTEAKAEEVKISGSQQVQMIQAARLDLYTQLARQIKGLNISEESVVANSVTLDLSREASVQALVKGVQETPPAFMDDICIISGSITLQQVIENINSLVKEKNNQIQESIENIKRYNKFSLVKGQGTGTLPAPPSAADPSGFDDAGLAAALSKLEGRGQHKLNAVEMARLSAYANLAAQIKGMKISDQSTMYNAAQSRWTSGETSALVKGAQVKKFYAMNKELIACYMEITLEQIVENVQKNSTIFANGKEVTTEKIQRFNGELRTVKATGFGSVNSGQSAEQNAPAQGVVGSVE
jgi:hypothetical protein